MTRALIVVAAVALIAAAGLSRWSYAENSTSSTLDAVEDGGSIEGTIKFEGTPPRRRMIDMKADAECLKIHAGEKVAVEQVRLSKDRGLRDVFVFVKKGLAAKEYPIPEEPAQLNQVGCMYRPRVQGLMVGQKFNVVNSDPTTHNVRGLAKINRPFNFGQIGPGTRERVFKKPEHPVKVKCDIHPWMVGFIFILDHPYFAVTDADGKFSIKGLPAGKYTIEAWHELFGKQTLEVEVSDSGSVEGNFTFEPKEKR